MAVAKLSRDQKKARRDMEALIHKEFKTDSKTRKWGYLKPSAFNKLGDWFVCIQPMIWTDEVKSQIWACVKPYAIDDLISKILGFDGLDGSPLSLRARGPHCLVRPMVISSIESDGDVDLMMSLTRKFFLEFDGKISALSLNDFIAFSHDDVPVGKVSVNETAALILADRGEEASRLCDQAIDSKQLGGPSRVTEDGRIIGFFELTKQWLRER
jgi:hypothetical protein